MKMQMISGWNKKFLHWVTDYTRSKVLSPQWPVWPKTSALFFSLSCRLPLFFKPVIVAVWRQPVNFLCHIFILIEDKLCSYRVLFFFSLLLYFSLLWMSWYHWCSISFSSLLTIQHAEKFSLSTKIFKFKFSNFLN